MKSGNVKVFFRYEQTEPNADGKTFKKPGGKIEAVAVDLNTNEELARREVKRRKDTKTGVLDPINPLLGRKYAFKKLMDHTLANNILSGETVQSLWKSFGSMCKQPSTKLAY